MLASGVIALIVTWNKNLIVVGNERKILGLEYGKRFCSVYARYGDTFVESFVVVCNDKNRFH